MDDVSSWVNLNSSTSNIKNTCNKPVPVINLSKPSISRQLFYGVYVMIRYGEDN